MSDEYDALSDREIEELRRKLAQYPGATPQFIDEQVEHYIDRAVLKRQLIESRQLSNRMAEKFLDAKGYLRPPGWNSVFFYPGGSVPRLRWIAAIVAMATALTLIAGR
jgi:hypothetical protein